MLNSPLNVFELSSKSIQGRDWSVTYRRVYLERGGVAGFCASWKGKGLISHLYIIPLSDLTLNSIPIVPWRVDETPFERSFFSNCWAWIQSSTPWIAVELFLMPTLLWTRSIIKLFLRISDWIYLPFQDKRYLDLESMADERSSLLTTYLEDMEKRGPPPPPTASEPQRRK